jgi:hypothetical protein
MTFSCGYCPPLSSVSKLKWESNGSALILITASCCVHYFQGIIPEPHNPSKQFRALACSRIGADRPLGWCHPFRKLLPNLLRQDALGSREREILTHWSGASSLIYREPITMSGFRSLEDVSRRLPGWLELDCTPQPGYSLQYEGQSVLAVAWIAPGLLTF